MNWSAEDSRNRYSLHGWGEGYFDVNGQGHLTVSLPLDTGRVEVDLYRVAGEIRRSALNWPVLVRCTGILRHRIDRLCSAFAESQARYGCSGAYTAAYPIKVNQQFSVVQEILDYGAERVGLEAGSKAELMAVLGLAENDSLVICNGYKDREYIRLALIARKLGQRIYLVIEKLSELELIIRESRELGVTPLLGVRVRLASIGAGNWQNTGGDRSKFGLHATQVLQLVESLRSENMVDRLQLLHFHLGSQLPNLADIKNGMQEAARFYAQLHVLGIPIRVLDVGGGLGVDYEGTASRGFCSMNYTLEQYADAVVEPIARVCVETALRFPDLVSESGRALTAHHAFLITNVLDSEQAPGDEAPSGLADGELDALRGLASLYQQVHLRSPLESYHDAAQMLDAVQRAFCNGELSLEQRALAERYCFATLRRILPMLQAGRREHRQLIDDLNQKLADKYFCNFSIFQSLPDVWAIKQIFPIVPLHRLDEVPERMATIQDLTCDSDGRIDYYVDAEGSENSLPLHRRRRGENYLLGFFMLGAYQEILGDIHNLFGDTDTVNLDIHADGSFSLNNPEHGDRADELLAYVHFKPDKLRAVYRQRVQAAGLPDAQARQCLSELEAGLTGYTYHED
jgi:arginine decarboxylase